MEEEIDGQFKMVIAITFALPWTKARNPDPTFTC